MSSAAPQRPLDLDEMFTELRALKPVRDPLQEWMAAHADELAPLVGQRVAIDPARGMLASGSTLEDVHRQLAAAGLMDDQATMAKGASYCRS